MHNEIKQVHQFLQMYSVVKDNGKFQTEIQRTISKAIDAFQKLNKMQRNNKDNIPQIITISPPVVLLMLDYFLTDKLEPSGK